MEWIERLNQAIGYIEEHLQEEIDYEQLAKIACCSSYHFQRMFSYLANVSLAEYIRRRRMSLAAVDLQAGDMKVIDVALKYGYESPTAFNRAFQSVHGIAPSQAKSDGIVLKAHPPISFLITIKGDVELNYRIEKKEALRMIGVSERIGHNLEENFAAVPMLWQRVATEGILERLLPMMNSEPKGILGISASDSSEQWRYWIAVSSDHELPQDMGELMVPACTWAIFPGSGRMPEDIQLLEKRIVTEWLPTSGYEYADAPDIEVYFNADPQNAQFEVWLPVVKK